MTGLIRTLLFSSLYPSSVRPGHGIFVETRLRELLLSGRVHTTVVSPVPWFFSTNPRFGEYALMARTPARENYHGIDVLHPRYMLPPKVGMTLAPLSMALGAWYSIQRLLREGFEFDLIDAHYFYPDGVAAGLLAKWFQKPYVVTARGTDLNLIPQYLLPRKMICWAAANAHASIGVSKALTEILRGLGLPSEQVHVMRNGVDLKRFVPVPPIEARRQRGIDGAPILMSVGNLVENKGHHIAIEALADILGDHPTARLVVIGRGPEKERLCSLAQRLGVESRVHFAGAVPNLELFQWYSAADVLVLASSREGWANVLLEAMACGTPVVVTRLAGTPEVVTNDVAGRLVDRRDGGAFANAIRSLLSAYPDRSKVREYAEQFGWQSTTEAQISLFDKILRGRGEPLHA